MKTPVLYTANIFYHFNLDRLGLERRRNNVINEQTGLPFVKMNFFRSFFGSFQKRTMQQLLNTIKLNKLDCNMGAFCLIAKSPYQQKRFSHSKAIRGLKP